MASLRHAILALCTLPSTLSSPHHSPHGGLLVKNDHFIVQGSVWPRSGAHFFGAIPYAEPPIGDLRFRPPVTKSPSSEVINGSWFGPSCVQYSNGQPTVYSQYLQGFLLSPGQSQSEDCLTLNVWTPRGAKQGDALPVMIWIHGGGSTSGSAASQYKYGDRLAVEQNVIVVAMNYRLNIFGFPGAAALDGNNLNPGYLDQRKAVEWVYQNIYAFGGDAEQMILFGQSAGGQAVDAYSYAWSVDPLVQGFIAQSGVASDGAFDAAGRNFTYVAAQIGCDNSSDKDAIFGCMQQASWESIIQVYNKYNASQNDGLSLSFGPAADNQTKFSNYTDLQERGLFARRPTIYSTVNNEGASLVTYNPAGVNQTAVDSFTASFATCPGNQAATAKAAQGVAVWRVRYFGEWPNLNPLPWLGAYHSSDIPMIFGTSDLRGPDTPAEAETSRYYQSAWATFARDPSDGLRTYGWPTWEANASTLVKLGVNGSSKAIIGSSAPYDTLC